jgi:flagellar M-ring protein FliF
MAALLGQWNGLARSTKLLVGGLLLALIAAAALVFVLGRDDRVPLYGKPLLPEQVAEVDARLASWNVSHRTSADNVLVEPGARSGLLLKLSLDGVPRAHVVDSGEALAKVGTLTPQSVLEAQARQGLEGDLVTALRGIDGIQDAYVLVAPAKAAFFADEAPRPASASVKLMLQPGAPPLSPRTVDGIRTFVANGVPGLDPARVSVMDDRGTTLGGDALADGDGAKLQHDVQHALDAAFGPGTTQVLIHADTDARASSQREIKRAPVLGKPIASSTVDERYSGASKSYTKVRSSEDRGSVAV